MACDVSPMAINFFTVAKLLILSLLGFANVAVARSQFLLGCFEICTTKAVVWFLHMFEIRTIVAQFFALYQPC